MREAGLAAVEEVEIDAGVDEADTDGSADGDVRCDWAMAWAWASVMPWDGLLALWLDRTSMTPSAIWRRLLRSMMVEERCWFCCLNQWFCWTSVRCSISRRLKKAFFLSRLAWAEARLRAWRASRRAMRSALMGLARLLEGVRLAWAESSEESSSCLGSAAGGRRLNAYGAGGGETEQLGDGGSGAAAAAKEDMDG